MFGSPRLRIMTGVAALAASRVVMILYNFLLVPILLTVWGVHVYGEWVVLTAIASIASLSNVGFAQASNAEIIMRVASGDYAEARRVYTTTLAAIGVIILVVILVAAVGLSFTDTSAAFGIHTIALHESRMIVGISLTGVVLSFLATPPSAVIAALHGAGPSNFIMAVSKVVELATILVLAHFGASPVMVTAVPVVMTIVNWVAMIIVARRSASWLHVSVADVDRNTLLRLMKPSLGMFLLYASINILAVQMPRVVVGRMGGAVVVALFSVTLTYVRSARIISALVGQSLQIELSRAFSEQDTARMEVFFRNVCRVSFWTTLLVTLALVAVSPWAFRLWTHGRIGADLPLLVCLAVAGLIGAYGDSFMSLFSGINRIWPLALSYTIGILAGLALAIACFPWLGAVGMAIGLAVPEISTAAVGILKAARIFSVRPLRLFVRSLGFPGVFLLQESRQILDTAQMLWRKRHSLEG